VVIKEVTIKPSPEETPHLAIVLFDEDPEEAMLFPTR
jgi:hypothetical protein